MAGQSANLSLSEARAMQNRVQHSGSQAKGKGGSSSGDATHRKGSGMMKKMPKKSMKSMEDC
jgi:hypothetical protein